MYRTTTIVAVLALTLAACSDPMSVQVDDTELQGATSEYADAPVMAAKNGNQPASSGQVDRFEGTTFIRISDTKNNLHVVLGTNIVEACTTGLVRDVVDVMQVNNPNEALRYHQRASGQVTASVWEGTFLNCQNYVNETPLLETTVNFRYNDNDVNAGPNPGNNQNAYGYSFNGKGLNGHSRCNWDGVDVATIRCSVNVNLN